MPKPPAQPDDKKPFSLHGMTPEAAIQRAFGTKPAPLALGTRVRVTPKHDLEYVRGAEGIITIPSSGMDEREHGIYTVQFDQPVDFAKGFGVSELQIAGEFLEPL